MYRRPYRPWRRWRPRPVFVRPIVWRRPLWRPFWGRPLGCGMGMIVPLCLLLALLAVVARHL